MILHADADQRLLIYRRLERRNRIVAILRLGIPALGVIALAALMLQIYISSQMARFGIGRVVMSSESVTVETPEYSGLFDDGTTYRVSALAASAAVDATDRITLQQGMLTMTRPDGLTTMVEAPVSVLDTTSQVVEIEGEALVSNSEGTSGTIFQSVFDYEAQSLVGRGAVDIAYRDGTHLLAHGVTFDVTEQVWTFTRATVTLPNTPGADEPLVTPP